MNTWYSQTKEEVLQLVNTTGKGLSDAEAEQRLQTHGFNKLTEKRQVSPLKMLFRQFTETMVLILIAAALLSGFLGKTTEAVAILAIVLLFCFLGFYQEYRAENAMAALNRLVIPIVRARRNGGIREIPASDLVPGDIVEFEAGNVIPADLRLLETFNLKIQEAALTGESEPVEKETAPIVHESLPLGDRSNMAFMGTVVTYGRGAGIAVGTGMATELGKIADLIDTVQSKRTPLQENLDKLGKLLALAGCIAAALIFGIGIMMGAGMADMFLTAVSVAVAVIPEGLPAVVTITLAIGGQRMLKRHALIRKLPAVETLGAVTVICSDKTGTLTQNKMTVTVVDLPGESITFDPGMAAPEGQAGKPQALDFALAAGVLCNDATLEKNGDAAAAGQVIGDPTETALLVAGARRGIFRQDFFDPLPRVGEVPFDSSRKRMSTIHQVAGPLPDYMAFLQHTGRVIFTKGAADSLLPVSDYVWADGRRLPLDAAWKARIVQANTLLAEKGIRVLALAFRELEDRAATEEPEQELTFLGLAGMIDPPREEVKAAIEQCKVAGIRPIMITGDHPLTAGAIATELKMAGQLQAVSGEMLSQTHGNQLAAMVAETSVYARVSPEDKLRIVEALQSQGEVVAMTGDGVNDSPALKKADIGVAMGITGTDVAKEAADMVLLDDNFATIVAAIEEGRVIFDNLRRFVKFSLAGNVGKVLVMFLGPFFGLTITLRPLQLLWLNLLTDGLLGLGLGTEPPEKDIMRRQPRQVNQGVLEKKDYLQISTTGVLIAAISLGLALYYYNPENPQDTTWQTILFSTIGFAQVFQAFALRSSAHSPFDLFTNPLMLVVFHAAVLLQLAVIYLPFLANLFGLVPLPIPDLLLSWAAASIVFFVLILERKLKGSRKPGGNKGESAASGDNGGIARG